MWKVKRKETFRGKEEETKKNEILSKQKLRKSGSEKGKDGPIDGLERKERKRKKITMKSQNEKQDEVIEKEKKGKGRKKQGKTNRTKNLTKSESKKKDA